MKLDPLTNKTAQARICLEFSVGARNALMNRRSASASRVGEFIHDFSVGIDLGSGLRVRGFRVQRSRCFAEAWYVHM